MLFHKKAYNKIYTHGILFFFFFYKWDPMNNISYYMHIQQDTLQPTIVGIHC